MLLYCLLDCIVLNKKYAIILIFVLLFIMYLVSNSNIPHSIVNYSHHVVYPQYLFKTESLYFFTTFIQFSHLPSHFKHFSYDVSWYNCLHVSSAFSEFLGSLGLLVFHIVEYSATHKMSALALDESTRINFKNKINCGEKQVIGKSLGQWDSIYVNF